MSSNQRSLRLPPPRYVATNPLPFPRNPIVPLTVPPPPRPGAGYQELSSTPLNNAGRGAWQRHGAYTPSILSIDTISSQTSLFAGPYPRETSEKFSGMDNPSTLLTSETDGLMAYYREDDDALHMPTPTDLEGGHAQSGTIFTIRGLANLGFLFLIFSGFVILFAGYPIMTHFISRNAVNLGTFGPGGINASGQVPEITNFFSLVDHDTPASAMRYTSLETREQWDIVFSDEFNRDNRTFYPGDDPYWEAVDLHYYATNDLEYYSPDNIITQGGALRIRMDNTPSHGLDYQSGMLQSWNKFCFTGGYVEVAVSLPGFSSISGLWPAVWTMGNLGRAGFGSTTDGTWPYSYDSCDVGTLANQTQNGLPAAAVTGGAQNGALSFLPGQRLSACTCPGEKHPGPVKPDGTLKGRSAPEIDVIEAIVENGIGKSSQSAQWAPFDDGYNWANSSSDATVLNPSAGALNPFRGSVFQESTSGLFTTDQTAYSGSSLVAGTNPKYAIYGFEYKPGLDGYITWVNNGLPSWTMGASAVGANPRTNVSARPIPEEPMYLLANLGMSTSFGQISPFLTFPAEMYIDYVRVYQDPNAKNIGCSPKEFPTEEYIESLPEMYGNTNLTTFEQAGQQNPRNRLLNACDV